MRTFTCILVNHNANTNPVGPAPHISTSVVLFINDLIAGGELIYKVNLLHKTDAMEYRQLGNSGLRVPVLSFGTATFGGGNCLPLLAPATVSYAACSA
jgi:hypothetical protein